MADIGGSHIRLARPVGESTVELLAVIPTPTYDCAQFSSALVQSVRAAEPAASGLSISIAGVVSPTTAYVAAANIPCIAARPLAAELAELLSLPVVVTNDADCAALAEARVGVGAGRPVVFCAILRTGVGGGLIDNHQLVPGAGEWGHGPVLNETLVRTSGGTQVSVHRFECGCGQRGCVDIVWPSVRDEYRQVLMRSRLLAVTGRWQRDGDACSLIADEMHHLTPLLGQLPTESRNFK